VIKIKTHLKELDEVTGSYTYNKEFDKVKDAPKQWLEFSIKYYACMKYRANKKEIKLTKKELNDIFSFQLALSKYHPELEYRLNWKGEVPKEVINNCG
jgi:hypothetical protein